MRQNISMSAIDARRASFRELHASGCFVIPNPWDAGSARYLQHLGFKAVATTSAGAAFSRGYADGALGLDDMLAHIREIVNAVDLPVNADFQSGYAADSETVAQNVKRCVETGVAGLSVEDLTGDAFNPLFDFDSALDRIRAARKAIDETGSQVLLTARSECYLAGHPDPFAEALRRLPAFRDAGADVLFAPGVVNPDEIRALVDAVSPNPFNLLVFGNSGLTVPAIADLGVRRVSVGGALARCAWGAFSKAAKEIAEQGAFTAFEQAMPSHELNSLFGS
jgi:2-methylisocitrate lyase-like PEP mutase family enzyme